MQTLGQLRQLTRYAAGRAQCTHRIRQAGERAAVLVILVIAVERGACRGQLLRQAFRVAHDLAPLGQVRFLAGLQVRRVDLLERLLQLRAAALFFVLADRGGTDPPGNAAIGVIFRGVSVAQRDKAAQPIEIPDVAVRLQEGLVLVLAVDVLRRNVYA